jgi:transcriptional regulator with XRE-family HTH domain
MTKQQQREQLADQLRRAIEGSGITLYQLSQASGVHRSQLSRFMRGERDLGLVIADKVCQVLGIGFCRLPGSAGLAHVPGEQAAAEARKRAAKGKARK